MVITRSKVSIDPQSLSNGHSDCGEKHHDEGVVGKGSSRSGQSNLRPKKKTKRSRGAPVGVGSYLSHPQRDNLTSLPLDMIHEILELVTPLDLLNLARTSKVLRWYLMSKRSSGVWKRARAVVDPPITQCPRGLSEPQLAVLLFTEECTMCTKKVTDLRRPWWILQLRLCKTCSDFQLVSGQALAQQFPYLDDPTAMLELVPRECPWRRSNISSIELDNRCRLDEITRIAEAVEDYQLRIQAKMKDVSAEFARFVERCKSEVSARCESATMLANWFRQVTEARQTLERGQKEARKRVIVGKLLELGYEDRPVQDVACTHPFISSMLRSTKPITPAGWKCMQPTAERLVQEHMFWRKMHEEEGQVHQARRRAFVERYGTFKAAHVSAPWVDALMPFRTTVLNSPAFRTALYAEGTNTKPEIFDEAFSELPIYLEDWKKERRIDLARAILKARPTPDSVNVDPEEAVKQGLLSLATSVFATCARGSYLRFDSETVHWADSIGDHFGGKAYHPPSRRIKTSLPEMKCVRVVQEWVNNAKLLVQLAGLDPETATIGDMDSLNARFYCNGCSCRPLPKEPVARNWRNGIKHLGFHKRGKPSNWTLVPPEEHVIITAFEEKAQRERCLSPTYWDTTAMSLEGKSV